jgi:hypothetical protein
MSKPQWILQLSRISEVTGESELFYQYRVLSGRTGVGRINKIYLKRQIEIGRAEIITNPLEAYAWEVMIREEEAASG